MMSPSKFSIYAKDLKLSEAGIELLRSVRPSEDGVVPAPVRRVESHVGNSIVRYPSRKMGFVIEAESGRAEYLSALELEHEADVLEYYSQPCKIRLRYASPTGKALVVDHTPDFLVLRVGGVEFRECKSVDGVRAKALSQPNRYREISPDHWVCPPGDESAQVYGIKYSVWTPAELPSAFAANLRYLDAHFKRSADAYVAAEYHPIFEYVEQHQGVTLDALCEHAGLEGPALVRWMIAHGHLYCDLRRWRLSDSATALIYTSREVAKAAEHFLPSSQVWPAKLAGDSVIVPAQGSSVVSSAYMQFGVSAFGSANRRLAILEGRDCAPDVSTRTLRSWKKNYSLAQRVHGAGYVGLLPKTAQQGNRTPRFKEEIYHVADDVIQTHYLDVAGVKISTAYRQFADRCAAEGLSPVPSQVWFWGRVKALPLDKVVAARKGPRAVYPIFGGAHGRVGSLDVHGDYPLHVVHIDHTELDVEIRGSTSPLNLGRPWLTVAFDAASRSVLGFYLSFESPSTVSVLMVLRDVVFRHGLLPFGFTVDNGPEFRSVWFEAFCGLHNILVWRRPPHQGRFGALIENFFGVATGQLFHSLEGNTQLTKNVRQLSKSVNPKGRAIWTLSALYDLFDAYCFEHFNGRPHAELGQSPQDAFKSLLEKHGVRALRSKVFDDAFLIATMETTDKGTARVQAAKGVKVRGDYFYNEALSEFVGQDVSVRFDAMDPGRVFCELHGKWVQCLSKYADRVAGFSVRQVQSWAAELAQRYAATERIRGESVARFGRFIEEIKNRKEGELRLQYERALANREVLAKNPRLLPEGTPLAPVPVKVSSAAFSSTPGLAEQLFSSGGLEELNVSELPPA